MSLHPEDRLSFLYVALVLVVMIGVGAYFWLATNSAFFAFLTLICCTSLLFLFVVVFRRSRVVGWSWDKKRGRNRR